MKSYFVQPNAHYSSLCLTGRWVDHRTGVNWSPASCLSDLKKECRLGCGDNTVGRLLSTKGGERHSKIWMETRPTIIHLHANYSDPVISLILLCVQSHTFDLVEPEGNWCKKMGEEGRINAVNVSRGKATENYVKICPHIESHLILTTYNHSMTMNSY